MEWFLYAGAFCFVCWLLIKHQCCWEVIAAETSPVYDFRLEKIGHKVDLVYQCPSCLEIKRVTIKTVYHY